MYEVSDEGEVRSLERVVEVRGHHFGHTEMRLPGGILAGGINRHGYRNVGLSNRNGVRKTFNVHRLVCEAFHGPRPTGMEVCHGPNGKLDNRASQLRWGTRKENMADKLRDGTSHKGVGNGRAKLTEDDVRAIWARKGEIPGRVAKEYGVTRATIRFIWLRLTWQHLDLV